MNAIVSARENLQGLNVMKTNDAQESYTLSFLSPKKTEYK